MEYATCPSLIKFVYACAYKIYSEGPGHMMESWHMSKKLYMQFVVA